MKNLFTKYERSQTFIEVIDSTKIIENVPILKAIDWFIEKHVDEEDFVKKLKNLKGGRRYKHPKMMLKVLFYAYTQGVYSSREIESQLKVNINFKAISADSSVDHSTICKFINFNADIIKGIFVKLTYVLMEQGFIDLEFIAIDGTKMKANAGERFYGSAVDFEKRKVTLSKKLDELLKDTSSNNNSPRKINKRIQIENCLKKIDSFLEELDDDSNENKDKVNLTDRDSRKMKISGSYKSGYNCQAAADNKNHIIVGQEVYNNASDYQFAIPIVEKVQDNLNADLSNTTVSLDAGYYSSRNLMALDQMGIDACIPEGGSGAAIRKKKTKALGSRDCTIFKEGDKKVLICPNGVRCETTEAGVRKGKKGEQRSYNFTVKQSICKNCPLFNECYMNYSSKTSKKFSVGKDYFDSIEIRKKMEKKLNSNLGKQQVSNRACLIEHVFGEIKQARKFRQFYHRGLTKVRTSWSMLCTAYNLNKLAKLKFQPT